MDNGDRPLPLSDGQVKAAAADLASRANEYAEQARRRLQAAEAVRQLLVQVHDSVQAGLRAKALLLIRKDAKAVGLLAERSQEAAQTLAAIASHLDSQVTSDYADLERSFPRQCADAGFPIDTHARMPKCTFDTGFIRLELDRKSLEARIQTRDGKRRAVPRDSALLLAAVSEERQRLFEGKVSIDEFADRLRSAYAAQLAEVKAAPGAEIPLKGVAAAMAKVDRVRSDEFNVLLSRLVRNPAKAPGLSLSPTRDAKDGFLLWEQDQRGYVGYISYGGSSDDT